MLVISNAVCESMTKQEKKGGEKVVSYSSPGGKGKIKMSTRWPWGMLRDAEGWRPHAEPVAWGIAWIDKEGKAWALAWDPGPTKASIEPQPRISRNRWCFFMFDSATLCMIASTLGTSP